MRISSLDFDMKLLFELILKIAKLGKMEYAGDMISEENDERR